MPYDDTILTTISTAAGQRARTPTCSLSADHQRAKQAGNRFSRLPARPTVLLAENTLNTQKPTKTQQAAPANTTRRFSIRIVSHDDHDDRSDILRILSPDDPSRAFASASDNSWLAGKLQQRLLQMWIERNRWGQGENHIKGIT